MNRKRQRAAGFPRCRRRMLGFEPLERRWLLAMTVDTLIDEADGSIVDGDISLRDALAAAPAGETIDFDASLDGGTILLTMGELVVTKTLTIDATALPSGLTIDASGNDPTPDEDNGDGSRVFTIDDGDSETDSPVTIAGLTLTGGDVSRLGGAILSRENLTVSKTTTSVNSARWRGGGIWGDDVTVTNSTISDNAITGYDSHGGGISGDTVTITNSTISGNSASRSGGGIWANSVKMTVTSSTISGNSANGAGGGVYFFAEYSDSTPMLASTTVSGNSAGLNGGGGVFVKNSAAFYGFQVALMLASATISGNSGGGIVGIRTNGASVSMDHSIVAGNSFDLGLGTGILTPRHSLIGDNTGTTLAEAPVGMPDANGNLIGDPDGMGIIDPLLGPLADNGGPTQTHALLLGSPAIDAGDPSFTPPPDVDQRGSPFARVFGGRIDMGAHERQTGDVDFDGDIDHDDSVALVLGLRAPDAYEVLYGAPPNSNGDTDGDGDLDFDDIAGFAELVTSGLAANTLSTQTDPFDMTSVANDRADVKLSTESRREASSVSNMARPRPLTLDPLLKKRAHAPRLGPASTTTSRPRHRELRDDELATVWSDRFGWLENESADSQLS